MPKGVKWGEGRLHRSDVVHLYQPQELPEPSIADQNAVLAAYDLAKMNNQKTVNCYKAAKQAWRERHPNDTEEYSAKNAVAIVLDHRILYSE